jgi:hypothetical protein
MVHVRQYRAPLADEVTLQGNTNPNSITTFFCPFLSNALSSNFVWLVPDTATIAIPFTLSNVDLLDNVAISFELHSYFENNPVRSSEDSLEPGGVGLRHEENRDLSITRSPRCSVEGLKRLGGIEDLQNRPAGLGRKACATGMNVLEVEFEEEGLVKKAR